MPFVDREFGEVVSICDRAFQLHTQSFLDPAHTTTSHLEISISRAGK